MAESEMPPTRQQHALEESHRIDALLESMTEAQRTFVRIHAERLIEARVRARAPERHQARVEYARRTCEATFLRLTGADGVTDPEAAAAAIALLALIGQGGPKDLGGPEGASQLPLLPVAPIWRWTRRTGGAWCSALQVVADGWRLGLRPSDDGVAVFVETVFVGCDRALQIPPVGDFRLAIRRLLRRVCESRDDDRPAPRAREVPLVDGSSTWVELEGDYEVIRLLAEATICDLTLPGWA